jgi:hypothetical protein
MKKFDFEMKRLKNLKNFDWDRMEYNFVIMIVFSQIEREYNLHKIIIK